MAEGGTDPLVVTSKDFAGFVVIESSQSPTKKEEVRPFSSFSPVTCVFYCFCVSHSCFVSAAIKCVR